MTWKRHPRVWCRLWWFERNTWPCRISLFQRSLPASSRIWKIMRSSKEWRRALEKARQVNNCTSFFFLISFPEIHLFFSDYWITIMYIVVVKSFKRFCCCWKFTLFKYLSIYFFCCYSIPYIFHWILSF